MRRRRVLLVTDDGETISGGLGRAALVTIADVEADEVRSWEQHAVGWRDHYDQRPHRVHHEEILRFITDHHIEAVVAEDVGAPMRVQLQLRGLPVFEHGGISALTAAVTAGAVLNLPSLDRSRYATTEADGGTA